MERWPTGRHHKPLTNIFTRPISTWNIFTLQIFIFNLTDCGRTGDINWSVSVKCHIWAGNMWHPVTNVHCIVNCYSKCWVTTGTARSTVGSNLADDEEMPSKQSFYFCIWPWRWCQCPWCCCQWAGRERCEMLQVPESYTGVGVPYLYHARLLSWQILSEDALVSAWAGRIKCSPCVVLLFTPQIRFISLVLTTRFWSSNDGAMRERNTKLKWKMSKTRTNHVSVVSNFL